MKIEDSHSNFVKGHLAEICNLDGSVDLDNLAYGIVSIVKHIDDYDHIQKAVLGAIVGHQKYDVSMKQLSAVSSKVAKMLYDNRIALIESMSDEGIGNLDEIFNLSDVKKKRIFRSVFESNDERRINYALQIISKIFQNDFEMVSLVIDNRESWSDQTVENALYWYLAKSKDNRVPDVILETAKDGKRKPAFRRSYYRLLGEQGRNDQIDELEELRDQERDKQTQGSIQKAIEQIRERNE